MVAGVRKSWDLIVFGKPSDPSQRAGVTILLVRLGEQADSVVSALVAARTFAEFGEVSSSGTGLSSTGAPAAIAPAVEPMLVEEEGAPNRALRKPKMVQDVEREAREVTGHTPHRDWCVHCVAGVG